MSPQEVRKAMKQAKKKGWVKEDKRHRFSITKEGEKHLEAMFPQTMNRVKKTKISLRETFDSCESEQNQELIKELGKLVSAGKLVKIISMGQISWIDSRSAKPEDAIILEGAFEDGETK